MKKIYSVLLLTGLGFTANAQCTGPTAVCQDINVYLDAAGSASILGSDLDGGSTDDCVTGSLTFSASQTAFTCADLGAGGGGGLVISGVYDGPLSGGHPKGIELYAGSAIADLSNYGVGSANNGQGTDGEEFTFPAVSVAAGTFIYVVADSAGFHDFMGFAPDFEDGAMSINGDDAVELFQGGAVIDVFGDINMDGTGTAWDHVDGWAYRNSLQSANGGVFTATNWSYSGPNALDNETSNATATTPIPVGTFLPASGGIPVTLTVTDGNGDTGTCIALVTVLDTVSPTADMAVLADETSACEVLTLTAPTATDNCAGPITGTTSTTFPISSSTTVVWMYDDGNGNLSTQNQNVIISDNVAPVLDSASLVTLIGECEVTPAAPTATDNCVGSVLGTTSTTFPITASTTITWTYDDGNGNTVTQDQMVTISGLDVSTTTSMTTITANNTSGVTYQWIDCSNNAPIVGETSQSFTAPVTGDYAVIIDNGVCADTSVCENVVVLVCAGPNAICQNIDVYLDAAGNATIADADLDGGSVDVCGTGALTFAASQTAFACGDLGFGSGVDLIITGAYDGPLTGGNPKGIELYTENGITDLSNYGVGSANNGQGTNGIEFSFPADVIPAGTFIYVSADSAGFHDFFGFAPDYVSGAMGINGDDAVELFEGTAVIDVFGDINMDGTGTAWDHLDGWAYRNDLQGANGGVFDPVNWSYSGINALDNEASNATAVTPFPVATYAAPSQGTPVVLTVTDGLANTDMCTAIVSVYDTLAPTADVATLADETASCEITTLTAPTATDNCSGAITGTTTATFPITTSGTTVVTWTYVDAQGNISVQDQNVIISDATAPVFDLATLADETSECSVGSLVAPTATDNCSGVVTGTTTATFPITAPGTTVVTWTYTDASGNISTQDQNVIIDDVTAPVADVATLADLSDACEVAMPTAPTATDNCGGTITGTTTTTFPVSASSTITWTYEDANGNISTQDQIVTITGLDVTTTVVEPMITANAAGLTYQWIDCSDNSPIAGETGQSFVANLSGDFAVIITDGNCSDTSACVAIQLEGIDELVDLGMNVSPNPSTGIFNVTFENTVSGMVTIVDANGRLIQTQELNNNAISIDLTSNQSGLYFMNVTTEDGVSRQRIVKY